MKLEIQRYECLCSLAVFKINGIEACYEDFGDKYDIEAHRAPEYCCANMQFIPKLPTQEILDKYQITVDEYSQICKELDCLSFGSCGWCD